MRWSVLLPTNTRPDTLALTIRGVLSQTESDLELLVIGEADASISDSRVHWFDVPGEQAAGVRTALAAASGRYLAFAEEGKLWGPEHLATLGALLDAELAVAYSRPTMVSEGGIAVPLPFDLRDPDVLHRFERGQPISPTFLALSMAAVSAAGGWPSGDAPHRALLRRVLAGRGVGIGYTRTTSALAFMSGKLPEYVSENWLDAATVPGGTIQSVVDASSRRPERWWRDLDVAVGIMESRLAAQAIELQHAKVALGVELDEVKARLAELEDAYREVPSWRVPTKLRETFDKQPPASAMSRFVDDELG